MKVLSVLERGSNDLEVHFISAVSTVYTRSFYQSSGVEWGYVSIISGMYTKVPREHALDLEEAFQQWRVNQFEKNIENLGSISKT